MKKILLLILLISFSCSNNQKINGLEEEVEVLRDDYGINHIYANNENDLFFMQGYLAAKDRLFQFEIFKDIEEKKTNFQSLLLLGIQILVSQHYSIN